MKGIILASGRGTRLKPLTNTVPKPMIEVCGKPIIEHNLENIYSHVDEIILVVKYLKGVFIDYFGDNYKGVPITYHIQGDEKGTAAALWGLDIDDDMLIFYGDSIIEKSDLESIFALEGYGCLVKQVEDPEKYGIFLQKDDGTAEKVVEKPTENYGNLANMGAFKFSSEIITIAQNVPLSARGEYEITDAVNVFCAGNTFHLVEMQGDFIDIGYPWQLLSANSFFLDQLSESRIEGEVEENVIIKGNIILEKGAVLKSGTYIEGNCIISEGVKVGPNAYLRGNTVLGKGAKIGNAVEVKNSSIGNNSSVAHLSYIGDSIVGNNVNIGGGTITANVRHDKKDMRCMINGKLIDTGIRKLGAIIGDGAAIGINNSIYPGRVIDTNGTTLPGAIVK